MIDGPQKINTTLIPESGLNLSPEFVQQANVSIDFSRVFAHLVGKGSNSGVLIRATADGSLIVSTAGVPFNSYVTSAGIAGDAFAAGDTFEFGVIYNVTDFLIETFPAIISFQNHAAAWLPEKILPVGFYSIDLINYGIRIRNRNAGDNSVYSITSYRSL